VLLPQLRKFYLKLDAKWNIFKMFTIRTQTQVPMEYQRNEKELCEHILRKNKPETDMGRMGRACLDVFVYFCDQMYNNFI